MQDEIILNITPYETRVATLEKGIVQEVLYERAHHKGYVGNIYLGKVVRVLPGMQSAFIDIGLERAAFLHIADVRDPNIERSINGQPITPIEKILFEGQSLMVQVIKDPLGAKGARLTTQISIPGKLLVYLPFEPHIGISQKIVEETERDRLRQIIEHNKLPDEKGGYIVRTQGEYASDTDLLRDMVYLSKLWQEMQLQARKSGAPELLHEDLSLPFRILRDFANDATKRITTDDAATVLQLQQWAEKYTPTLSTLIQGYQDERPLFDRYRVDEEVEKALSRRVDLKSGGYLIIDQTEALTTIDVNTGGYVGGKSFDDTVFRTNLEACSVIIRQLRLRNLGGMIVVDFIDMENAEHQEQVLDALQKAAQQDRTRITIHGFTHLGLVEITRKRTRESLAQYLCEDCPSCQAKGRLKTATTVAYTILREIQREALQFNPKEFRIVASQSVIDLFLDEESENIASLHAHIGKLITLQVENSYHQEQFDIVLL